MISQRITPFKYKQLLGTGKINFESDVFKMALFTGSLVFNRSIHSYWDDVSIFEVVHQNGYEGAIALQSPLTSNTEIYTANFGFVSFSATGGSIFFKTAVMFDDTATDKPIIAAFVFPQNIEILSGSPRILSNINIIIGD